MRESENRNKRLEGRGGIEGHVDGQLKRLRLKGKRWGGERDTQTDADRQTSCQSVSSVFTPLQERLSPAQPIWSTAKPGSHTVQCGGPYRCFPLAAVEVEEYDRTSSHANVASVTMNAMHAMLLLHSVAQAETVPWRVAIGEDTLCSTS